MVVHKLVAQYTSSLWRWFLLTFLLLGGSVAVAWGQKQVVQRRPYADYRVFHLGFHVGMHTQDLAIINSGSTSSSASGAPSAPLYGEVMDYTPGFSVGLIADYTIKLNWELRFVPTLHLSERAISFSDGEKQIERLSSRSNLIEFPLLLKYSSQRMNNIRPYMLAGGYAALQIGQKRGDAVHFKPVEYGLKVGVGCDIYLPFFKLCPELSLSYGLGDVIQHERPDIADDARFRFTQALRSATPRMILLTFHFE